MLEYIHSLSGFCTSDMTSNEKAHCISHNVSLLLSHHR